MQDLTNAVRQLVRRPALPVVIIAILAIGIGVTTGIFSLFHQLLLKPLPVPEPERLVNLAPSPIPSFSYPMFRDLEARQEVLTGLAAYDDIPANLGYETRIRSGSALAVSGQYFEVLGLQAALGRLLGPQDEPSLGGARVAVLSHDYWQRDLQSDPGVLGATLMINGQPLTIVGVAPAGFASSLPMDELNRFEGGGALERLEGAVELEGGSPDSGSANAGIRRFKNISPGFFAPVGTAPISSSRRTARPCVCASRARSESSSSLSASSIATAPSLCRLPNPHESVFRIASAGSARTFSGRTMSTV